MSDEKKAQSTPNQKEKELAEEKSLREELTRIRKTNDKSASAVSKMREIKKKLRELHARNST